MKGVFNIRPPLPRYQSTWDVGSVLTYLKGLFPLEDLDLRSLSMKLVALLALCSAQRAQALVNLNLDNMSVNGSSVSFIITSLMKTSKLKKVVTTVSFEKYVSKELCPVYTMNHYIKRTKKLRKSRNLIVSFRTFDKICTSTLARWLKSVLFLSGVNTDKFKAHSFRSASTSVAYMSGVTLNDIMKTANWQSAKTFKKFYCRNFEESSNNNSFTKKVLSFSK